MHATVLTLVRHESPYPTHRWELENNNNNNNNTKPLLSGPEAVTATVAAENTSCHTTYLVISPGQSHGEKQVVRSVSEVNPISPLSSLLSVRATDFFILYRSTRSH